jgi:integron integrase
VLTEAEVHAVLAHLSKQHGRIAQVLYGSGVRLMECLCLRVNDIDFAQQHIVVRDGKGMQDRITLLPQRVVEQVQSHLADVRLLHQRDLTRGYGVVYLPCARERKYPNAPREWPWQYTFRADTLARDPRSGVIRRHHGAERRLQHAVRIAAQQSGVPKRISCHTFRHSFATHVLQHGYDIRTLQELLGHKDVKTTMVYTHVLNRGGLAVRSPLDHQE